MADIATDIEVASSWASSALSSSGYMVDGSPQSVWEVELFFLDHSEDGQAIPGGLLDDDLGQRLFALGAYVGEVIRREKGGAWVGDDSDPEVEVNVELQLADGLSCWPMWRVIKRFKQGPENSIAAYGVGLGLAVGPRPLRR